MSQYLDNKDSFMQPQVNQYGSHMVMTNVYKPSKTKFWNIDTRFRDDYDNYAQTVSGSQIPWYTFTLPQPINDIKSIRANNAEIPLSFYAISASLGNNVMGVGSTLITIPDGNYTELSLKVALNKLLASVSVAYDCSSNGNPISSFTNTSGSPVILHFAVRPSNTCQGTTRVATGNPTPDSDKYNFKSKLGWLLGFRSPDYTIANNATKLSENVIDIASIKYVYLVIDEFTNSNSNSFVSPLPLSIINKNILAKISMDYVHYGLRTILTANLYNGLLCSDRRAYNGKINMQKLKIQLVNEYGVPLNLNGLDFSFCLEIEYE
jgi:hypothetical protein